MPVAELLPDLDDMSFEQLDALPCGVVQVDGSGRTIFCNTAQRRVSGLSPDSVAHHHFFTEIAPSTHVPAFHGRFIDGVRRGGLSADFGFVFASDPPVHARVRLSGARAPDRYWIVIDPHDTAGPGRHRAGPDAAQGPVQPHAALLALDPASLIVTACSDNIVDATGREPPEVLGHGLSALLPDAIVAALRGRLDAGELRSPHRRWHTDVRLGPDRRRFALSSHRRDGRLILELEMVADTPEAFGAATSFQAQDAVGRLRAAATLADAAGICSDELRAMTGFERVLICRGGADGGGEVIGESRDASCAALLGRRFSASEIPALDTHAPARFVVERDAAPAEILMAPVAADGTVDLGFTAARAPSPIDREHQRALGVDGSMAIAIVVDGLLWGQVIGHHRRPHYVTPDTRALAALVADAFALRAGALATTPARGEPRPATHRRNALLRDLAGADDPVAMLVDPARGGAALLDLLGATGAAIVGEERIAAIGAAPPEEALRDLVGWLRGQPFTEAGTFATAGLSERWPGGAAWRDIASGLLAAADSERRHLLLWFRPELAPTAGWDGDPARRGRAEPWASWHADAAGALAAAAKGVAMRQRALTVALKRKDMLGRESDHRIKNSLQFVASILLLQTRRVADPAARTAFQDAYGRVMSIARVHDSLRQSDRPDMVDLGETMRRLCDDLSAGIADGMHRIDVRAQAGLIQPSRVAVALAMIATELVSNALKHAYPAGGGGPIGVDVRARGDGRLKMSVRDEGCGLPDGWDSRPPAGGGLGMRVIGAMLEQIGASLSAASGDGRGACLTVTV